MSRNSHVWKSAWLCVALAATANVHAAYPDRQIRIVTPYDPGSMVDTTTRAVAEGLSKKLGQAVIVENRSGGMGSIAMAALLNAPADGYTLLTDTPASAINPTLNKTKYNPKTDIAPIAQFMKLPFVVAVNPSLKVNTAQELVDLAKKQPGAINVAVAGTSTGLVGDLFAIQNGIQWSNVPYKGAGAATLAALKDEGQVIFLDSANLTPHINAGKLKGLLITSDRRSEILKEVPTAKEAGFGNYVPSTWFALFARAEVPADVQEKLNQAIREIMASPKLQEYLQSRGATASDMSTAEFKTFFNKEVDTWAEVIKKADIKGQ